MRSALISACLVVAGGRALAAAPSADVLLRSSDVVAVVGGEDMVVLAEQGWLETALVQTPGLASVKVRSLAVEGDTVFEQFRQLNFPSWSEQLQRCGATVVLVQFGQSEALEGTGRLGEFTAAYNRLLEIFLGENRRLIVLTPTPFEMTRTGLPDLRPRNADLAQFATAAAELATRKGRALASNRVRSIDLFHAWRQQQGFTRDGRHLNAAGQREAAESIFAFLNGSGLREWSDLEPLRKKIMHKNRLWFHYSRPQNWAFLHGDRVEQLFSRDHRDPNVRKFLIEMEKYAPLIAAAEEEIGQLAAAISAKP